jgi:uncharacterized protein with ParB-like and HNH nuclease domain
VSLLIEALARALGDTEPVDGFSAAKLRHYFLSNPLESGDRYFKLLLSQTDNASLKAIIKNGEQPKEPSLRVTQNFALFTGGERDARHQRPSRHSATPTSRIRYFGREVGGSS